MQMFADEPDAVKRLMASQYRVAPERLMRTGTFGNAPFPCKFCLENTQTEYAVDDRSDQERATLANEQQNHCVVHGVCNDTKIF